MHNFSAETTATLINNPPILLPPLLWFAQNQLEILGNILVF